MGELPDLKVVEDSKDAGKKKRDAITLGKLSAYWDTGVLPSFMATPFKASTAILVGKFSRFIQEELRIRGEKRNELVKEYGEKADGEDGEGWQVVPPSKNGDATKWATWRSEVVDLDEAEINLSQFSFRTADFKNAEGKEANISGLVIQMLLELGLFKE